MIRIATANWKGNLKEGNGILSTQSEVLDKVEYSYKTRFEDGEKGTNPEELLAAAHAACFTMSVVANLTKLGANPISLDTIATLTMERSHIDGIHLSITGIVEGITSDQFTEATKDAEKNCIISKALFVVITSEAHLDIKKTEQVK